MAVESTKALAAIPVLTTSEDYLKWERSITDYLRVSGLGLPLNVRRNAPTTSNPITDTEQDKLDDWMEKQDKAKGAVLNRMSFNARAKFRSLDTVADIMDGAKAEYTPKGAAVLELLYDKMLGLTLTDFPNVQTYAGAICQVDEEIRLLDPALALPEAFLVTRFLKGLGPDYKTFTTSFFQTRRLYVQGSNDSTLVTLQEAAMAAEREEQSLKAFQTPIAMMARSTDTSSGKKTIEVDYCDHCDKIGHRKERCFYFAPRAQVQKTARKPQRPIPKKVKEKWQGS